MCAVCALFAVCVRSVCTLCALCVRTVRTLCALFARCVHAVRAARVSQLTQVLEALLGRLKGDSRLGGNKGILGQRLGIVVVS